VAAPLPPVPPVTVPLFSMLPPCDRTMPAPPGTPISGREAVRACGSAPTAGTAVIERCCRHCRLATGHTGAAGAAGAAKADGEIGSAAPRRSAGDRANVSMLPA